MKKIPKFENEDKEREFWSKHDSSEFLDWNKADRYPFSNLKPSLKTISLRLPEAMLETLKMIANKRDVPYQSLLKTFLADRIKDEIEIPKPNPQKSTHNKRMQRTRKRAADA
jgi:predicted DNA binding CopG/RHH family protein